MDLISIRLFAELKDVERAQPLLTQSGIESTVLEIGPVETPLALCVTPEYSESAERILAAIDPESLAEGPICAGCDEKIATIHLTSIVDGKTTETDYCLPCCPVDIAIDDNA